LRDLIIVALETGMRKGELLGLQWRDVRWMQNDIRLPAARTKTRRDRKIPISPALREVFRSAQEEKGAAEPAR
jgi:integrase